MRASARYSRAAIDVSHLFTSLLTLARYWAFLLAHRCEFDASARMLLQIWEHGGGSDLTSDRITHFLILSLHSGRARSWSSSGSDEAASDIQDCTVGVSACPDITPTPPPPAACLRNWQEFTGGSLSRAIASAAAAAHKVLAEVPPTHVSSHPTRSPLTLAAVAAGATPPVGQREHEQVRVVPSRPHGALVTRRRAGSALTIVTASNALYFTCMGNMVAPPAAAAVILPRFTLFQIGSLHAHEPDVNIVIYDLGQLLSHTVLTVWFSSRNVLFPAGMDPLQRQIARSWRQVQVAQPQRASHCFSHEHYTTSCCLLPSAPPSPLMFLICAITPGNLSS